MKERTLYHLLIVVGNQLARECESDEIKSKIQTTLDSLAVTKERQKPYVISFNTGQGPRSITCDAKLFTFHSRGDLEVRVRNRSETLDLSGSNREQAITLWTSMVQEIPQLRALDKEPSRSSRLAKSAKPFYLATLALGIWLIASKVPVSAVVALSILATSLCSPFCSRFSMTRLSVALPVLFAALHYEPSLSSLMAFLMLVTVMQIPGLLIYRLGSFLIAAIVGALATTLPHAVPALLLIIAFEIVSAVSSRSTMNRGGLLIALVSTVVVQVLNPVPVHSVSLGDMSVVTCSLILSFAFAPALTHQSLVRIWAPLGIAVVHIFSEVSYVYGLCILALWCTASVFEGRIQSPIATPHRFIRTKSF